MDSLDSNLPKLPKFPQSRPSLVKRLTSQPMVLGVVLVALLTSSLALVMYLLSINKNATSDRAASSLEKTEPTVTLKTQYKNPLKLESQYVNPFDTYKSPLYSLKEGQETK